MSESPPTVLVTDAARGSALCIIQSLGRKGWKVVAADASPACPAFQSKFCTHGLVYPSPKERARDYCEALLKAVREHGVDLILPVTDEAALPLVAERRQFEEHCRIGLPDPESMEIVQDKGRTLELARELGIDVPASRLIRCPEDLDGANFSGFAWPLVIKPVTSRIFDPSSGEILSCSVSYAEDLEDLHRRIEDVDGLYTVLVQEYCAGVGVGVEMVALGGQPLASFQHRRLAEVPVTGGASAWRVSTALDPTLLEAARTLVSALSWTGPIMVEFKVSKNARLMEINGRIWGSLPLATTCGVDFPGLWAQLLLEPGSVTQREDGYPIGVQSYNPDLIWSWIANVALGRRRVANLPFPSRIQSFRGLGAVLNPRCRSDFAARDDSAPRKAHRWLLAKRLLARSIGRQGASRS